MSFKKKIFIIEDERNMRNAIKRMVRQNFSSVEVFESGDGKKALSIVETYKPDLILLDVLMPSMNGLQVLKILKENENMEIRRIPVIMLTAVGNREIATKSKKMGAVDYMTKPFNEKIFLLKMKKYLKYK